MQAAAVLVALLSGPALVATPAQPPAASSTAADDRVAAPFLQELQRALARDDRDKLAALTQFPLTVFAGGFRVAVPDAAALRERYDIIFTPELKAIVAQTGFAGSGRQSPKYPIAVSPDGVTIGVNAITAKRLGADLRITQITVPLSSSSVYSAPSAPANTGRSIRRTPAPREPRRILFRAGQALTQVSGGLARGETESYLVWATKGEGLEIRVDGVRGRDVVARLIDEKTRTPVDPRAGEGFRTWAGRMPSTGDYRIEVVRLAASSDPALRYVIVIGRR